MSLRRRLGSAGRRALGRLRRWVTPRPPTRPGYRSRFGGLWVDRDDAPALVEARAAQDQVTAAEADQLRHWIRHGYLILPAAVPRAVVERVNADTEAAWAGHWPGVHVEHWPEGELKIAPARPELRGRPAKLLDLYAVSAAAREAAFAPPIRAFLRLLFERPALAFQSLSFIRGSEQPMHQDTAYVVVSSPLELVASWIALEDIADGSGELEYYEGSHRLPEFGFAGGAKHFQGDPPEHDRYLAYLHAEASRLGLSRRRFRPRAGDVLIWAADLAHGGARDVQPGSHRLSLVTHYCPLDVVPGYFRTMAHAGPLAHTEDCYYDFPRRDPGGS